MVKCGFQCIASGLLVFAAALAGSADAGGTMLYKTVDKNGNVIFTDRPPATNAEALVVDESKKAGPVVQREVATKLYCGQLQLNFVRQPGESVAAALNRLQSQRLIYQTEQENAETLLRMHQRKLAADPADRDAKTGSQKAFQNAGDYRCAVNYLNKQEAILQAIP
ncbi:DUF4124 domain-containing protein [Permianibacter sp. IMCC34836]|uniref:DUF4124 domain-containing protein n=1 Tax=Permianibacter fluminis TaxID=2738515 RepID=UPI0015545326|nr:DUF4124 domain-containing protein [Permianibacter fluminis]NQD35818.1 DUF4124 domain-containing protein [Permianibacter fluminis]